MDPDPDSDSDSDPSQEPGQSPIHLLPMDAIHHVFSNLPLRHIIICRSVCKLFKTALSSPPFLETLPPFNLLALRRPISTLHVFDPTLNQWFRFPLDFLPFPSAAPVASSLGLLYLWSHSNSKSSLVLCNPLTRQFRVLPQLGSAWSRHGTVLVSAAGHVLLLSELAALYFSADAGCWRNFSSNLPAKPRSPVVVAGSVFALCDVGSPWRSQWTLFSCRFSEFSRWDRLERHEWGDIFDILKRPRLVSGAGNKVFMVGGLKSSFALNSPCSTILILRLDLDSLEWDEAGRMPTEMFGLFQESTKFKVFGGGGRVWFSGKRVVGRFAMWDYSEAVGRNGIWRWVEGVPGNGDGGLCRGFVFDARLTAVP
ncbi:SKP1-interacting partner 15 [Magnolia sinica]|uniref:SKP1-interacting partner 15 n=1 Tax=Magnolia sinica TaxID=86752 RepID=UPI00265A4E9B|nr:SKP1-interacting partner 15 [Magnolia sinica]